MAQEPDKVEVPLRKLTRKQKLLVDKYVQSWNATRAAIAAGYSKKTATYIASRELTKVNVKQYLDSKLASIADKNQEKVCTIIEQLMRIARADIRDYVDSNGNLRPINKNFDGQIVQSVKHTRDGVTVVLHSKEKAMELLGRYLGLWTDKVDITSNGQTLQQSPVTIIFEEMDGSKIKSEPGAAQDT